MEKCGVFAEHSVSAFIRLLRCLVVSSSVLWEFEIFAALFSPKHYLTLNSGRGGHSLANFVFLCWNLPDQCL